MVLNESEQAKQELMHFGMRGMRWGVRKMDTRVGLAVGGGSKLSLVPGGKAVREANKKSVAKFYKRADAEGRSQQGRYNQAKGELNKTLKQIKEGPGGRFSKFIARETAINSANEKYRKVSEKGEKKYVEKEVGIAVRTKAKQDAFSNKLKDQMEAEIKSVTSKGGIVDKIFAPAKIEMKYHKLLVEGLSKIDEEEG